MNGFFGSDGHKHKYQEVGADILCKFCSFPMPAIAGGDLIDFGGYSGYLRGYGVNEFISKRETLSDYAIALNGKLTGFKVVGWLTARIGVTIEDEIQLHGVNQKIEAYCWIGRFSRNFRRLKSCLESFVGKTVGMKLYVSSLGVFEMKFGDEVLMFMNR